MKNNKQIYISNYIYTTMIYVEEYLEEHLGVMFIKINDQEIGIQLFFNDDYTNKKFTKMNMSVLVEARYMTYHKIIEDYIK